MQSESQQILIFSAMILKCLVKYEIAEAERDLNRVRDREYTSLFFSFQNFFFITTGVGYAWAVSDIKKKKKEITKLEENLRVEKERQRDWNYLINSKNILVINI